MSAKRLARGGAVALAMVLSAAACGADAPKEAPSNPPARVALPLLNDVAPEKVAEVNGVALSREQLAGLAVNMYGRDALKRMIQLEVVRQEAEKQGVTVSATEIAALLQERLDLEMAQVRKRLAAESDDEMRKRLAQMGTTPEKVREETRKTLEPHVGFEILSRKLLRRTVEVTEADVRAEFDRKFGPKVKVAQIVVQDRQTADNALRKLRMGADFAQMVADLSEDPISRNARGELPPLPADSTLGRAVGSLKPGEIAEPVEISGRWHIARLISRAPAEAADFGREKDALREEIIQRRMMQGSQQWLQQLIDQAEIKEHL